MGANRKKTAGLLLAAFAATAMTGGLAMAQEDTATTAPATPQQQNNAAGPAQYASGNYLAYIKAPSVFVNNETKTGLTALANTLIERTSYEPEGIAGLDIEQDDLSLFPFIYWPVTSGTAPLSEKAQNKLQNYIDNGGMIVIDVRDQSLAPGRSNHLKNILGNVRINNLTPMEEGHSLTKSFYLVSDLRGSNNFGKVWVESDLASNGNSVSSVIIGQKNWAGAWAGKTLEGRPKEYENAIRSGINMIMYALSGNYKQDALHAPVILEKMEKRRGAQP